MAMGAGCLWSSRGEVDMKQLDDDDNEGLQYDEIDKKVDVNEYKCDEVNREVDESSILMLTTGPSSGLGCSQES